MAGALFTGGGDSYSFIYPANSPAISADGGYFAFTSSATDLVAGQTGGPEFGVFLYDRAAGTLTLVSHSAAQANALCNGISRQPGISADGRYVAYWSGCPDLVAGSTSTGYAIYLYDRLAGTSVRIGYTGDADIFASSPVISADGGFIAFGSTADLIPGAAIGTNLYLYDRAAGTLTQVTHGAASPATPPDGASRDPVLSADGRYLAFHSDASNLVAGQNGASFSNTFLYDRIAGTTTLVSHAAGTPTTAGDGYSDGALALSADGRWLAFTNRSTNLVSGVTDTNHGADVFLFDRTTGTTTLVTHAAGSATTTADGTAGHLGISADGSYLALSSTAGNLVAGQSGGSVLYKIFLHDRTAGTTVLVSHVAGSATAAAAGNSYIPGLSADGRYLSFASPAADLIAGQLDINGQEDVFFYDRVTGVTSLVSRASGWAAKSGNSISVDGLLSADGGTIVFSSYASNLDRGVIDDNNARDVVLVRPLATPLGPPGGKFFTLTPCRLIDTRQADHGPELASGLTATLAPLGLCGIPETARALAVNVTVTEASAEGFLTLAASGGAAPSTSTINFSAGQTRANNAIVALALDGTGNLAVTPLVLGGGTVQVILDVSGYFD